MKRSTTSHIDEGMGYQSGFGGSRRPPSTAVVEAVLELEGKEPEEITALYEVLDPDALDALFEDRGGRGESIRVSFTYEGYSVEVRDDGRVRVRPDDSRELTN